MRTAVNLRIALGIAVGACLAGTVPALGAPGSLDAGFGRSGRVVTDFSDTCVEEAVDVARRTDRSIVVAAEFGLCRGGGQPVQSRFGLVGYTQQGALKRDFGRRGRVVTRIRSAESAIPSALLRYGDDSLLVAGSVTFRRVEGDVIRVTEPVFLLVRYREDGRLEADFGRQGVVVTRFAARGASASDVIVQPGGKIVAVGTTSDATGSYFALARYLPNGRLDPDFGQGGKVVTQVTAERDLEGINGIARLSNGKLVAVGYAGRRIVVARYTERGNLDPTFGNGGYVFVDFAEALSQSANDVLVEGEGRIVVAGTIAFSFTEQQILALRVTRQGTLDPTFDGDGFAVTGFNDLAPRGQAVARGIALTREFFPLRYVVGGSVALDPLAGAPDPRLRSNFALVRYLSDGSLDRGFSNDGRAITNFRRRESEGIRALAMGGAGFVTAAGVANDFTAQSTTPHIALARYRGGAD